MLRFTKSGKFDNTKPTATVFSNVLFLDVTALCLSTTLIYLSFSGKQLNANCPTEFLVFSKMCSHNYHTAKNPF